MPFGEYALFESLGSAWMLLISVIFLVAARRVGARRWRTFLLSVAVLWFLRMVLDCMGSTYSLRQMAIHVISGGVLAVVVRMDLAQRKPYPWSHWVGIGVFAWSAILAVVLYVYSAFLYSPPS